MNNLKYSNGSATYVESLEKKIAELEKQIVAIEMNNEPVAWMQEFECSKTGQKRRRLEFEQIGIDDIPLYTHPVKNLEDIDINITWNENSMRDFGKDELNFARAILRKASEK